MSGQAVDLAARIMSLALGGQILLSGAASDIARQNIRRHPETAGRELPALQWLNHGKYLFKVEV